MKKLCKEENCTKEAAPGRSRCYSDYGKKRRREAASLKPKSFDSPFKLLFVDIETKPTIAYTWSLFKANIGVNQIIEPGGMICFSACWFGHEEEMEFYSDWKDGHDRMVLKAWELLDQADAVCHYYGSRFDVPHINSEFLLRGFPPPSPFKQIDLKMAVSKQFRFPSNKLQFVSQVLGLEGKEEHEGFGLWQKCLDPDHSDHDDALLRMESYNKRDVELLSELYEVLLPWLPNHPNRHLYQDGLGCPTCGADVEYLYDADYYYTKLSKFKQVRCSMCNSYFRNSKREAGVKIQESML